MYKRFWNSANRFSNLAILFTLIVCFWSASNIMWGKHASTIIKADGKGYYAHLPAVFIYQDLNFGFFDEIEEKYSNEHLYYDYRKYSKGKTYNKYFGGVAIPMLPFFLIGHMITSLSGGEADGYSYWYQISISCAAIFYLILSLLIMRKILSSYHIRDSIIAFSILAIVFGTNWYYYVLAEPAMSHVYSVFLISLFLWRMMKWRDTETNSELVFMGIILGLITWVRPLNAIVILSAPLVFNSWFEFKNRATKLFKNVKLWPVALIPGLIVLLQLLVYKIQTGSWLIYSYEEEGFNFTNPQMWNILFSYKKGLFLYTPILLIALIFNFLYYKRNKFKGVVSMLFFVAITYFLSSWWNWYYGGSFSSRAYLEYYVFFLIPLAVGLNDIRIKSYRLAFQSVIVLLILFCQFQTYQYRYMVIHWDNMTKEKYWDVFLNFDFLM